MRTDKLNPNALKLALNLAVRGTEEHWQAAAAPLDLDLANAIYQPEIDQLNQFACKRKWWAAGLTGAALITVALDPRSLVVWERFSLGYGVHDHRGFDASGYLRQLVERLIEVDQFGRSPIYRHYLFQVSLAVVLQWLDDQNAGVNSRFRHIPRPPPIGTVIEAVRQSKGLEYSPGGFRPIRELDGRIALLGPLQIAHSFDHGLIVAMAYQAAALDPHPLSVTELSDTLERLTESRIPEELGHPAALAAAVVDYARHEATRSQWIALFRGHWRQQQDAYDMGGRVFRMIRSINRRQIKRQHSKTREKLSALELSIALYLGCEESARIGRQKRAEGMRWKGLPWVAKGRMDSFGAELLKRWSGLEIPAAPEVAFLTFEPANAVPAAATKMATAKQSVGSRFKTGTLAERYFQAHHASMDPAFQGKCLDMTTSGDGHDFQILQPSGQRCWVEVKGSRLARGNIRMTATQWAMAQRKGADFYLAIVRNLDATPFVQIIRDPARYLHIRQVVEIRKTVFFHADDAAIERALSKTGPEYALTT